MAVMFVEGGSEELINLRGLEYLLISVRVAQLLSQKGLSERLGISESRISRDEKNEYHVIKLEKANKILEALFI